MKVQIYSQWMEDVYIPVRVRQFTKAAKLAGHTSFSEYAAGRDVLDWTEETWDNSERKAVAVWLDSRTSESVTENVA